MSCRKSAIRASLAATRTGLSRIGSLFAYLTGLRPALALPQFKRSDQQSAPADYSTLPRLETLTTARPVPPETVLEGQCASCQAGGDKSGSWYRLGGNLYCADCAPQAAAQHQIRLAVPAQKGSDSLAAPAKNNRPDTSRYKLVSSSADKSVILADGSQTRLTLNGAWKLVDETGRSTGLTITQALTPTETGVRLEPEAWMLTHEASGRDLFTQPFPTPEAAAALGRALTRFDWTRPSKEISPQELAQVRVIAANFLQTAKHSP